jgi:hypothetical protein
LTTFLLKSAATKADLRLNGSGLCEWHCALAPLDNHPLGLLKRDPEAVVRVNGGPIELLELEPHHDYSLQVGGHFLLLRGSSNLNQWQENFDCQAWSLYDPQTQESHGPFALEEVGAAARQHRISPQTVASPHGAGMGFYVRQLLAALGETLPEPIPPPLPGSDHDAGSAHAIPSSHGAFTCPVCWLKFDTGDIMSVAVHDSLRGDPVLGADAPLRFHATQFNDRGHALDVFGLPCTENACPHCRRILPAGFIDVEHHIISIVGDQSAGKSYYLSVLVKLLPVALYRHFDVAFHDADPTGNAMLNDMKRALFSAQSPREARLVKTQLEGAMYERLPRFGRIVALPKPFIFYLHSKRDPSLRCSMIFYDNAGEHFQPGRDSADSPGAQHVASSSGILFLFDPFNNPEFRRRMSGHNDPQLERPVLDQQDVILSELNVRVKKLLNLDVTTPLDRPLAVLVGKCDVWMQWLGEKPFADPIRTGGLDLAVVQRNSDLVRALMLEIAPAVVANAEAVSRNVRYFPVSSFGHPPVKVESGDYVPDPRCLAPILVEAPVLWLLSQIKHGLVPPV